ncbi:hypothetical protein P153DRAFT_53759 [Dothidotthia symphoricarpi CBS 119687]|uniref:Uncharacterized protein n=1 Tax=Dothidotthia symphoricarpi CBS 119687 TaxID=1392245 RepID=A0A6A6AAH5_9PLEO|nr:uncharacterized protein P153DRAFT_53759 [Dothidotthia symphoricarpi CBS 119687]KAF2127691.1 hypothetical protein P153DRAFT_53759 [Dothidotthia symphoricarpi CBS 119687]
MTTCSYRDYVACVHLPVCDRCCKEAFVSSRQGVRIGCLVVFPMGSEKKVMNRGYIGEKIRVLIGIEVLLESVDWIASNIGKEARWRLFGRRVHQNYDGEVRENRRIVGYKTLKNTVGLIELLGQAQVTFAASFLCDAAVFKAEGGTWKMGT